MYSLKNFDVKQENLQFRSTTGHELEINVNNDSVFKVEEDLEDVPLIPFNFVPLSDVKDTKEKKLIGIISVELW